LNALAVLLRTLFLLSALILLLGGALCFTLLLFCGTLLCSLLLLRLLSLLLLIALLSLPVATSVLLGLWLVFLFLSLLALLFPAAAVALRVADAVCAN
jgi:hypothetical protein